MQSKSQKDLQQLLKIRTMRRDTILQMRNELQHQQMREQAKIESDTLILAETQTRVKAEEDENLNSLINQSAVHGHQVVCFNKLQLTGIRTLLDAEADIQTAIKTHDRLRESCKNATETLNHAEKNIIKLEEMTKLLSKQIS